MPRLTPEILHARLVQLLDEMPNLTAEGPRSEAVRRWTARATILVEESGDGVDTAKITVAVDNMARDVWTAKETILTVLHRALARAESRMPAGAKGGFIAAGSPFDALATVGKVLSTATSDAMIVDPYADERLLTDYALLAPESIGLRILTDKGAHKPALKPAAERWTQQHGTKRPLQVRLAAPKTLHDRLIIVDAKTVWLVGQSFNKLAERAHTSITRVEDADTAALKLQAYADMWNAASPL